MPTDEGRFFVKAESHLQNLEVWLSDRRFNYHYPYLSDRLGNRMIGLSYKDGEINERCGRVIVCNGDLYRAVVEIVKQKQERRGQ